MTKNTIFYLEISKKITTFAPLLTKYHYEKDFLSTRSHVLPYRLYP